MQLNDFQKLLSQHFPNYHWQEDPLDEQALIMDKEAIPEVCRFLKEDSQCLMHYLDFMTACDYPPERIRLTYSFYSFTHKHRLLLKVDIARDKAEIPSIAGLWQNGDWNEREVFDLFGVNFIGHPDLRRLLMPEDWEGAPLRKDYTHPNLVRRPD